MINRYPLWKNLLLLFVVSLGLVYALPNIYPPDFAVQISTESADGTFTEHALNTATARLEEESVDYFGAEMQENSGLIGKSREG